MDCGSRIHSSGLAKSWLLEQLIISMAFASELRAHCAQVAIDHLAASDLRPFNRGCGQLGIGSGKQFPDCSTLSVGFRSPSLIELYRNSRDSLRVSIVGLPLFLFLGDILVLRRLPCG
jgi:hypothetical protein